MRLSFRLKLTLLACVVAIVPLITVGWIVNDINREALQDTNRQLLDSVIASLSSTIETTITEGDRTLLASASALGRPSEQRDSIIEAALDTQTVIKHLAIYDATGAKVVEVDSALTFEPPALPAKLLPLGATTKFGDVAFTAGQGYVMRAVSTRDGKYTVAAYLSLAAVARRGSSSASRTWRTDSSRSPRQTGGSSSIPSENGSAAR